MSATLQRLELALLFVFQNFRKAYIGEQANVSSTNLYSRLAERVGIADHVTVMDVIMNKTMSNLKVCTNLRVRACVLACVRPFLLQTCYHGFRKVCRSCHFNG